MDKLSDSFPKKKKREVTHSQVVSWMSNTYRMLTHGKTRLDTCRRQITVSRKRKVRIFIEQNPKPIFESTGSTQLEVFFLIFFYLSFILVKVLDLPY